jgi:hypothetical protein
MFVRRHVGVVYHDVADFGYQIIDVFGISQPIVSTGKDRRGDRQLCHIVWRRGGRSIFLHIASRAVVILPELSRQVLLIVMYNILDRGSGWIMREVDRYSRGIDIGRVKPAE